MMRSPRRASIASHPSSGKPKMTTWHEIFHKAFHSFAQRYDAVSLFEIVTYHEFHLIKGSNFFIFD